ncbi:hypothetical protein L3i22_007530 [Actinoplanes sp. L3-i22]|nr:hypothetical protein L3i22_007530 [Actinoplanes sp. L3-i22]
MREKLLDLGRTAVAVAGFAAVAVAGMLWRDRVIGLIHDVTGGAPAGMAAAGWLVVVAPFLTGFLCWLFADRLGRPGRIALIVVTVLLAVVALWFLPGCDRHHCGPAEVTGDGAEALRTGTIFGALTGLPAAAGVLATAKHPNRRLAALLVTLWAAAMLALAVVLGRIN